MYMCVCMRGFVCTLINVGVGENREMTLEKRAWASFCRARLWVVQREKWGRAGGMTSREDTRSGMTLERPLCLPREEGLRLKIEEIANPKRL